MIDTRLVFLLLTALLVVILTVISVLTLRKSRKQKLEAPKYRMLSDE